MRKGRIIRKCLGWLRIVSARRMALALSFLLAAARVSWAEEKIAVFPVSTYDGYMIYANLAIFWIFILGLLIIIRLKLREIERIQEMGVEDEASDAPLLQ
jgi:hypothetical protein